MTIDAKLRWNPHIKKKQGEMQIKFRKMYWLLGRRFELSLYNKLLLYQQVLRPVWTYGVQLWGCEKSNINIIQQYQNKVLKICYFLRAFSSVPSGIFLERIGN
jgi:hypothetical protein